MKKDLLNYLVIVALAVGASLTSCNKDDDGEEDVENDISYVTMTTAKIRYVSILLSGGTVTIDWGDETDTETYSLPMSTSTYKIISHSYANSNSYFITLTGDTIIGLQCLNNQLTELDVSKNSKLIDLNCSSNQLKSLDLSKNTKLRGLSCILNQLTKLDVSKNIELKYLKCGGNQFTSTALDSLFETLHNYDVPKYSIYDDDKKMLYIVNNPGEDACNRSIATEKGWTFTDQW